MGLLPDVPFFSIFCFSPLFAGLLAVYYGKECNNSLLVWILGM
jgi:hypothetical protein